MGVANREIGGLALEKCRNPSEKRSNNFRVWRIVPTNCVCCVTEDMEQLKTTKFMTMS
jgi:hypothetical protein